MKQPHWIPTLSQIRSKPIKATQLDSESNPDSKCTSQVNTQIWILWPKSTHRFWSQSSKTTPLFGAKAPIEANPLDPESNPDLECTPQVNTQISEPNWLWIKPPHWIPNQIQIRSVRSKSTPRFRSQSPKSTPLFGAEAPIKATPLWIPNQIQIWSVRHKSTPRFWSQSPKSALLHEVRLLQM